MERTRIIGCFLLLLLICNCTIYSMSLDDPIRKFDKEQTDEWVLDKSLGISFWIALNSDDPDSYTSKRSIFLFVEDQHFTPENIRTIFFGLASRYPDTRPLKITAYSNKEMLQRSINIYKNPIRVFPLMPPDVLAKRKKKYLKRVENEFPTNQGYFRAYFYRMNGGQESIEYSPDPNRKEMILIENKTEATYTGVGDTDLILAAGKGDIDKVTYLLSMGVDFNAKDNQGRSALANAAMVGSIDIVRILLAKGSNINTTDNGGWTPLLLATLNQKAETVIVLLNAGAEVDMREPGFGRTALLHASGNFEITKALLDHGADVNVKDIDGFTALMLNSRKGRSDIVNLLLKRGADLNVKNNDRETALMLARKHGKAEVIETLLAAGAKQ